MVNMAPDPEQPSPALNYATPLTAVAGTAEQQYATVPWYRRSGPVSLMVIIGIFIGLTLVAACVIVATGPVYYPKLGPDGRLRTWSVANRVIALVLLALWVTVIVRRIILGI